MTESGNKSLKLSYIMKVDIKRELTSLLISKISSFYVMKTIMNQCLARIIPIS